MIKNEFPDIKITIIKSERKTLSVELKEALRILSAEERAVILLSIVCGYKSHEISEILDISASTVRSKQSRGLKKMQDYLNENGKKGGNKNEQEE